jgi:hypothetical protein
MGKSKNCYFCGSTNHSCPTPERRNQCAEYCRIHTQGEAPKEITSKEIIEVGKALLPYLRSDLRPEELGKAAHDAASALNRAKGLPRGLSGRQRLAIDCGNGDYADDKVCPECRGFGHVSAI